MKTKSNPTPIIELTLPRKFRAKDKPQMGGYLKLLFSDTPGFKEKKPKQLKVFNSPGAESRIYSLSGEKTLVVVRNKIEKVRLKAFEIPTKNVPYLVQSFDLLKRLGRKPGCVASLEVEPVKGVSLTLASF